MKNTVVPVPRDAVMPAANAVNASKIITDSRVHENECPENYSHRARERLALKKKYIRE